MITTGPFTIAAGETQSLTNPYSSSGQANRIQVQNASPLVLVISTGAETVTVPGDSAATASLSAQVPTVAASGSGAGQYRVSWLMASDPLPIPNGPLTSEQVNIGNVPAVTISGTPDVSVASGTIDIGTMPDVTIANASIPVSGSVDATIQNATLDVTGSTVDIGGAVDVSGSTVAVSTLAPNPITLSDYSGSILSANVSQLLVAANSGRKYLLIQNLSENALWINWGAAATIGAPSVLLEQAQGITFDVLAIATEALYGISPVAGTQFVLKEA